MNRYAFLFGFIILYLAIIFPFSGYLLNKPIVEKLGHIPEPPVLVFLSADQKQFLAESIIFRVITYFGGLTDQAKNQVQVPPDFEGMRQMIEASVKLDPYNMDSYYFTQAIMAWEMGQVKPAIDLLEYGMNFRTWDWQLPYFAGFNYYYILKNYSAAAKSFQRAGELSGSELAMQLAGRFLYESGELNLAIAYLTAMEKNARNDAIRKSFSIRLEAFRGVKVLETARNKYRERYKRLPISILHLIQYGFLDKIPTDPYGGVFYLDEEGRVRSTSKFAYGNRKSHN